MEENAREEIIYRLYDPVENSFIKRIMYRGYIKYNKFPTTVFSETSLINIYKEFITVKLSIPRKKKELKELSLIEDSHWRIERLISEIEDSENLVQVMKRIELQRCKLTTKEEKMGDDPKMKDKLFDKIVTHEMSKVYKSNITNWFFKHQRRVARKTKKPPFDPFCLVPSNSQRGDFFINLQSLGIPHVKVDTWSKDVVFNCEEDYNLFKLAIPEAKGSDEVIYYSDMKKKYQDIQTSISQQLENSF